MKRRRVLIMLAATFVAAVIAVVVWPAEREPEYQGKKLSEWLRIYRTSAIQSRIPGRSPLDAEADRARMRMLEASGAVVRIGTNGLPWMLKWMEHELWPWEEKPWGVLLHLPKSWSRLGTPGLVRNDLGMHGLLILGPWRASPAIPRLAILASDRKKRRSRYAVETLAAFGYRDMLMSGTVADIRL